MVFELACPPAFSIWRSLTYAILRDVGMNKVGSKHIGVTTLLENYKGLQPWAQGKALGRIMFASVPRSEAGSEQKIPSTEEKVCVDNNLKFRLFDNVRKEAARASFDLDIHQYCTPTLSDKENSAYVHLKYAVERTTHSHNSTIVKQGNCPADLSIHEQLAFSNLRCGGHLQWMNIARELRTRTLTFSRDEVHTLLMQAAWQIGPLDKDDGLRTWHSELGVEEYAGALIQEVADLLSHVEGNWVEGNTVKTIGMFSWSPHARLVYLTSFSLPY